MTSPIERSTPADARRTRLAWATWPADRATPVGLYLALRAAGHETALLESVEGPERLARYSFLATDPVARFRGAPTGHSVETSDGVEELEGPTLDALRRAAAKRPGASVPDGLPPFCGGWVGFLAYEHACALEPSIPRPADDAWGSPDAVFHLFHDVFAVDHAQQKVWVLTRSDESGWRDAQERLDALAADAFGDAGVQAAASGDFRLDGERRACTDPERFRAGVTRLKDEIAAGEVFQAVLSQRFEQRFEGDLFTLYRVLRIANPSPHMFFFEADGLTLVGSSPERLVSVRSGLVESRPIAGTRPRGGDPAEDDRLAIELRADRKERAEHDMLVDLARNDVGRVARIGSVRVREHAVLERFARVQHLVSRVECQLADGRDAIDALAACFPAGTVSGAPKIRAMQLVAELEGTTRGPYGGAFGYLDGGGQLDTAIVLRTFVARGDTLSVQAGAGVVFDSDPERELQETLHKASALFEACALADSDAFRAPRRRAEEVST